MKKITILLLLVLSVLGCLNKKETNSLLSTQNLSSEFFNIDINKDTLLRTGKGALIKIPKGTITSSAATVQLEVKEAYSMEEIIQAGLITSSNGEPLSSGGMIYINAVGESTAKIAKAISIATPTNSINEGMQIFKGEAKDGKINWTLPKAQTKTPQMDTLALGKSIFQTNCASCHNPFKKSTGPALINVTKRLSRDYLYKFTRNPIATAENINTEYAYYTRCLLKRYSPTVMTAYANTSDEELKYLYDYIDNESNKYSGPPTQDYLDGLCFDSCYRYLKAINKLPRRKQTLITTVFQPSVPVITDTANEAITEKNEGTLKTPPIQPQDFNKELIHVPQNESYYYQFSIQTFGWYNIDILLQNLQGLTDSKLIVRVTGQYKTNIDLFLIIPGIKVFIEGGPFKKKKAEYSFYQNDGTIPLPQETNAFIVAMGETNRKIIFGIQSFKITASNNINIELNEVTREAFNKSISALNIKDLQIEVFKNNEAGTTIDLKAAEKLKPKNCKCDCLTSEK